MDKLKLGGLGERLKTGGAQMGRMVSGKMKEILQAPTQESKVVDEATSDHLEEPNWGLNLRICSWLNSEEFSGTEVVRAIKKKIGGKNTVSQRLSLDLLETIAMNCEKVFSEIASEKVLDEMVKMIDNPQTHHSNRLRGLQLIRAWGESEDLAYLPVFRQTYENVKGRAIPSPLPQEPNSPTLYSSFETEVDQERLHPPKRYPMPVMDLDSLDDTDVPYQSGSLSVEGKKEFLVITRNSVELLSSMLNEAELKPIEKDDDLMVSMLEKCKQSQPVIQRMIETTSNDDGFLFEALNLHDNLQQIISKYEKMEAAVKPESQKPPEVSDTTGGSSLGGQVKVLDEAEKLNSSKG
ncbi:VHS [Macleaya cordata]|uniref:VHS n=1 Tax=Macleaya cordata TaxID=56857 RepID=A0A200QAR1_MACCD|nr:VHS [Macleaya cordata]